MLNKEVITAIFILSLPLISNALPTDKNQPANITANTADLQQKTGVNIFSGNVIITQGSTKITADTITTHNDASHKITEAIAVGTPATYQTLPKQDGKLFQASANTIEYFPKKNQVVLIGNGKLQQGGSVLQSAYIIYNQLTGQLITKLQKNNRTTITLEPNQPS